MAQGKLRTYTIYEIAGFDYSQVVAGIPVLDEQGRIDEYDSYEVQATSRDRAEMIFDGEIDTHPDPETRPESWEYRDGEGEAEWLGRDEPPEKPTYTDIVRGDKGEPDPTAAHAYYVCPTRAFLDVGSSGRDRYWTGEFGEAEWTVAGQAFVDVLKAAGEWDSQTGGLNFAGTPARTAAYAAADAILDAEDAAGAQTHAVEQAHRWLWLAGVEGGAL